MNARGIYFGLLGLIGLLVASLIAGAYGANNLLAGHGNTLVSLRASSQALSQEQISLEEAKRDIQKYADLEQIAQVVVPQDKDQAEAVRELVNIAGADGVQLGSITFPDSTLGQSSASSTTTSTSDTIPPTASSPNSSTNKLSQLTAVPGIPGVYQLTITITSDSNHPVQYNQIINFLRGLEQNRRTAQVSSIILDPNTQNVKLLNFTLTLNEYIKP